MSDPKPREAKRELRRWCDHEECHFDVEDDGPCIACSCVPCDACGPLPHTPRKRRMLICSVCEQGYFKREAFDAHVCSDAY